jgi:hypothetical protein
VTNENGPGAQGALRAIWGYVGSQPRMFTPLSAAVKSTFVSTADSWTGQNCTLTTGATFLTVTPSANDFGIRRTGLSFSGATNRYLHITLRRNAAGYNQEYVTGVGASQVFWRTSGHNESESFMHLLPTQYYDGTNFVTMTLDMHNPYAGGSDWSSNTITGLQIDPDHTLTTYHISLIEVSPYAVPSSTNLTQNL